MNETHTEQMMIGEKAFFKRYWLFSWSVTAPVVVGVVAVFSVVGSTSVPVLAGYRFPSNALAIGWAIALAPILVLIVMAGIEFARAPSGMGCLEKLKFALRPGKRTFAIKMPLFVLLLVTSGLCHYNAPV